MSASMSRDAANAPVGCGRHLQQRSAVAASLPRLGAQLGAGDELVVVDNASRDDTLAVVRELAPAAARGQTRAQRGLRRRRERRRTAASGDAARVPQPGRGAGAGLRRGDPRRARDRGWAAWMGLVTADGGRVVNTHGGVIHFTGIAWAGEAGVALARADRRRREVGVRLRRVPRGPTRAWERSGGFAPHYFMYHGGRRPLAAAAPGGRASRRRAGRARRPRLRVRQGRRQVAAARAQPLGDARAHATRARCSSLVAPGAAGHRGGAAGGRRRRRLARRRSCSPTATTLRRAAAAAARAARGPGDARDLARRSSRAWLTPDLDSPFLGRLARLRAAALGPAAYWRLVLRRASSHWPAMIPEVRAYEAAAARATRDRGRHAAAASDLRRVQLPRSRAGGALDGRALEAARRRLAGGSAHARARLRQRRRRDGPDPRPP